MRKAFWTFIRQLDRQAGRPREGLAALAREIAGLSAAPTAPHTKLCALCPGQVCPRAINFLVNGADPADAPQGLAGLLPADYCLKGAQNLRPGLSRSARLFLGCNFDALEPLAAAKGLAGQPLTEARRCGFELATPRGLALLFGPWADFCLHCWQLHPDEFRPAEGPILVLAKTFTPLAQHYVAAGEDWGARQLDGFFEAADQATQHLFAAILAAAERSIVPRPFVSLTPADRETLQRFIARRRILVFHVMPWFVCGKSAVFDNAGHDRLAASELVSGWVRRLVAQLQPVKIATLGAWAWGGEPDSQTRLAADIEAGRDTFFIRQFLGGTPFAGAAGRDPRLRHFQDPDGPWTAWPRRTGAMSLPWFYALPEFAAHPRKPSNAEAFMHFLSS